MEIISFSYSKYLVASSLLFLIPSYYAYHKNVYSIATALCITSLLSINHWRNAYYSTRRIMDVYWSRIASIVFICHSFYYVPIFIIVNNVGIMAWFYYQSWYQYTLDPLGNWYIYHMIFHAIGSINQCIIIYYI